MRRSIPLLAALLLAFCGLRAQERGTIGLDNLRVLYEGLDNPITVAHPDCPASKLKVSVEGGDSVATLIPVKGHPGQYIVVPQSKAKRQLSLLVGAKVKGRGWTTDTLRFRVKPVPSPVVLVDGDSPSNKTYRYSRKNDTGYFQLFIFNESVLNFHDTSTITLEMPNDFVYDIDPSQLKVTKYESYIGGNARSFNVAGNRLNPEVFGYILTAKTGDILIFDVQGSLMGKVNVRSSCAVTLGSDFEGFNVVFNRYGEPVRDGAGNPIYRLAAIDRSLKSINVRPARDAQGKPMYDTDGLPLYVEEDDATAKPKTLKDVDDDEEE